MKCLICLFTAAAFAAAPAKMPKQYTIEQLLDTVSMGGAVFSADESTIAVSSNKTGVFNVYSIPVQGGEPKQLTKSTESTYVSAFLPDGKTLVRRDRGGNENDHLITVAADGTENDLTPGEKNKAGFMGWNQDRSAFYYSTNARDPKAFDIYRMPVSSLAPELMLKNETGYMPSNVSRDGQYIAVVKPNSTADSDVFIYNTKTHDLKKITEHTGDVNNAPEAFDPAGKWFYYTSDEGGEFAHLDRYDLATGRREVVQKEPWDVQSCTFSRGGKYRIVTINADARTQVKLYDASTGKQLELPQLPNGDISGISFSDSDSKMAFFIASDTSPSDLYVYDFKGRSLKRLTENLSKQVSESDLVAGSVVRYKSFDGMMIPGLLYKPANASADAKTPAIVEVHGGPGGQSRYGYSPVVQYLVNHGYTVLRVNNRGSSGYGKTFFTADDKKHGREPLWDCVEAKNYLNTLPYVAHGKVAIVGGSYGGYMTLAALTFKPTEFAAGVDLFGISNWVRTLESIPPYWESQREALYKEIGDPKKDRDMLMTYSPLFHADKIERPLMVLQGANDPRVIKPESDEIVAAVKKRGGVVEYIVFPDEGHGFRKKANQIRAYGSMLEFLDKYVKNAPAKS